MLCIQLAIQKFSFNSTKQGHLPLHFHYWRLRMRDCLQIMQSESQKVTEPIILHSNQPQKITLTI